MLNRVVKDERGQVLVITLLSMTVLLGFMALAVDVGVLFRAKRNMQIAADAAAMAAATQLFYGPSTSTDLNNAGYLAAKNNGVDQANTANTVLINNPPADGPNTGCGSCVEARVGTPNPTIFLKLFGVGSVSVGARAVAGAPGAGEACVFLLGQKSPSPALDLQGNASMTVNNCGVYVNSTSSTAVHDNGNVHFTAGFLDIVGNDTAASSLDPGHVYTGVPPGSPPIPTDLDTTNDPRGSCSSGQTYSATTVVTGTAGGSSQVSQSNFSNLMADTVVCFTNPVTINSGAVLGGALGDGVLYVFEQGVSFSGAVQFGSYSGTLPTQTGAFLPQDTYGATIDLEGGTLSQGNASLSVFAPTSGTYNSIALMQPTGNTTSDHCPASSAPTCLLVQRGNSGSVFDGIIYAPGEQVELQDQAGGIYATGVIADSLFDKTSNLVVDGYTTMNPNTSPYRIVTMVE
jgi:Putative Flp pilus-assembly TadE/G-like